MPDEDLMIEYITFLNMLVEAYDVHCKFCSTDLTDEAFDVELIPFHDFLHMLCPNCGCLSVSLHLPSVNKFLNKKLPTILSSNILPPTEEFRRFLDDPKFVKNFNSFVTEWGLGDVNPCED